MFFKKSKQEADILPPPPPFPKLEEPIDKELETKEKIKLKPKKERVNIDKEMKQLEKEILKAKLAEEKPKPKKKFFKIKKKPLLKEKLELPEIESPKKKFFFKKQKIKEELPEFKEPFPDLEPIKAEKPPEIFQAEQEIAKAIEGLKEPKKKRKPSFRLFKQKEKLPEIPKEAPEKLPPPAIEEPKDEVIAIKHKIHDARNALMDFDLVKAKTIYIKIMRMYPDLSQEKQANVYEDITDLKASITTVW